MDIELKQMLAHLSYGTPVVVREYGTEKELFRMKSFITPYSSRYLNPSSDYIVEVYGIVNGELCIWVSEREEEDDEYEASDDFIERYEDDPMVQEGWRQQDMIDMRRMER